MPLYRIAYVSSDQTHSVVREFSPQPVLGDELALDANTIVTVREIIPHAKGDTITAEIVAETFAGGTTGTNPEVTGSGSRSSS